MGEEHQIILIPFFAQGHTFPFIDLASLLRRRTSPSTTAITLVSTPLNCSSIPSAAAIRVLPLPFHAPDHGLPPNAETTAFVPPHLLAVLFHASLSLQPHFDRLLSGLVRHHPHVTVIADVFMSWTLAVDRKYGAFYATFTTCGAYGSAVYMSLWLHLPHKGKRDDEEFFVPNIAKTFRLRRSQLSPSLKSVETGDEWSSFLVPQIALSLSSSGLLCNSAEELEPDGLQMLRRLSKRPVWAVGPLFVASRRCRGSEDADVEQCIKWLDTHLPFSVLYVSFGSQNTITAYQMMALAKGLEKSDHAFLWVVRPPIGYDLAGEFKDEWLPDGFEERVTRSGKGMVVRNWAPQLEILSHGAVGAFLSHCGWNSAVESLSRGVPVVGWPMAAEQFYNSKIMVEDMGVCVVLARGVAEEIEWEVVEGVVKDVMGGEKGEEMRRRAAEKVKAAMEEGKGSSVMALDAFLAEVGMWHMSISQSFVDKDSVVSEI